MAASATFSRRLARNPDTVRAPDIAFVRKERIPAEGVPRSYWQQPPDLAVEVLSPDDRPQDVHVKVRDYLRRDVRLVWVVDPDAREATFYRPSAVPATIGVDGPLDGGDVLPGFTFALRSLFA